MKRDFSRDTCAGSRKPRKSDNPAPNTPGKVSRMKKLFCVIACVIGLLSAQARATELEAFGAAGAFPFTIGIALRDLVVLNDPRLSLEVTGTNRWALAGIGISSDFGPAGRVSAITRLAFVYAGGVRLRLVGRGTFGPIASDLQLLYWTVAPDTTNPMVTFDRDGDPINGNGFLVGGSISYRLSRLLVVSAGGRFSTTAGSRATARLEYRETEFSVYGGALFAFQAPGTTYAGILGGRYTPQNEPFRVSGEILLGWGPISNTTDGINYGVSLEFDTDLPDELGTVGAYVVFEPWRLDVYPFRFGVGYGVILGPGRVYTRVAGGSLLGGLFQWGVQLGYVLFLDQLLAP